jgi:hypothetical protein
MLWMAIFEESGEVKSREFFGTLVLTSSEAMEIQFSLNRHGNKAFEGSSKNYILKPGVPELLMVKHRFQGNHPKVRLQLEVIKSQKGKSDLEISNVLLVETPESMVASLDKGEDVFALANSKFREARYLESAPLYLHLAHQEPKKVFHREMAEVAFQEAGIANAELIKKILFTLGVGLVTSK